MNFAQRLVDADRASLFLVDAKTNQLYARIFDIKGNDKESGENGAKDIAKEIRYGALIDYYIIVKIIQCQFCVEWLYVEYRCLK